MTHPFSVYIWQAPLNKQDAGHWIEYLHVYNEQYAVYVAGLIHNDNQPVIKVVRYGISFAFYPNKETVERVEKYLTWLKERR